MYLICGLASVYVLDAEDTAIKLYDLNARLYKKYASLYFKHITRAAEVMKFYGIDLEVPDFYRQFSNKFWHSHNDSGQPYRSGFVLSDLLSARREYNVFLNCETNKIFQEDDYTSFLVFNKAQLTKNYLIHMYGLKPVSEHVGQTDFAY